MQTIYITLLLFALHTAAKPRAKNRIAGAWRMLSANATTNGVTTYPYGQNATGLLIFTEDLYFAETLSVDPSTLPRFSSDSDRSSGTPEQNTAVVSGTIGQEGTYTIDKNGQFESNSIRSSTFPNYIGAARNTTELRLDVFVDGGQEYLAETLQDVGSPTLIQILYRREPDRRQSYPC